MKAGKLTAIEVKQLRQPGRHSDGDGLYLFVDPRNGYKSWVQRITVEGKRRDFGLGGYPTVSLAEARRKAEANKPQAAKVEARPKPVKATKKSTSTAPMFREVAYQFHAQASETWKNKKTGLNWEQRAVKYIFPAIGDKPVDEITRADVLGILTPVWTVKAETGRRLLEIIRVVLDRAVDYEYATTNVAARFSRASLPPMPKCKAHHKALPAASVADAIETVGASTAFPSTKLAYNFLIFTATRTNETLGATWGEMDMDGATWTVPAARMKGKKGHEKDHRVALSTGALAVLREAEALRRDDNPLVFPNTLTGRMLSEAVLNTLMNRLGYKGIATPHGFRAAFRTWADDETEFDFAVKEKSLAHEVGNDVVQSYARSDLLERRRELMQEWCDYLAVA